MQGHCSKIRLSSAVVVVTFEIAKWKKNGIGNLLLARRLTD